MSLLSGLKTSFALPRRASQRRRRPTASRMAARFDTSLGDNPARQIRGALEHGEWRAAQKLLDGVSDWTERDFYVSALCDWPSRPDWLAEWTTAEPLSPAGWLLGGAHGARWAWQGWSSQSVAGSGASDPILLLERLEYAEDELFRAASLYPEDPTAWVYLLLTGRGLGVEDEEFERRLAEVTRRCPDHRNAHSMALQHLCAKWHGSHDRMFSFARTTSAAAPEGSLLHGLVAEAHIERWLRVEDTRASETYWGDSRVRSEIEDAANRSVLSPAHRLDRDSIYAHNLFAFCASRAGDAEWALRHFEGCQGYVTSFPWCYVAAGADPTSAYVDAMTRIAAV